MKRLTQEEEEQEEKKKDLDKFYLDKKIEFFQKF